MGNKEDTMKQKIKQNKEKSTAITVDQLKQMATTKRLRDILTNYIEHEKIPSVKAAWIEYFLDIKKQSFSVK
jgi:predicted SnoaL-like aldol condensation-catalyzing enzyme